MPPPARDPTPSSRADAAERDRARERSRLARAWAIALDPVYGLVGFGLIGYLIDRFAGTSPRWITILAITGLIAGFYRFMREAKKLNAENSARWSGRPFRQIEPEDPDTPPPPPPGPTADRPSARTATRSGENP